MEPKKRALKEILELAKGMRKERATKGMKPKEKPKEEEGEKETETHEKEEKSDNLSAILSALKGG